MRYRPQFKWEKGSITNNAFNVFYQIFGRKAGIRLECSVTVDPEGNQYRAFHSWKAMILYSEHCFRELFRWNFRPFRIYIPVLQTPQGFPIFASPYLFAIAFTTNKKDGSGTTTITMTNLVVGSNDVVIAGYNVTDTPASSSPTGITWNTSENLTAICEVSNDNHATWKLRSGLYAIANPSAATANVVISNVKQTYATCMAYSGASNTAVPTNSATNTGVGTTQSVTLTGTASTSWGVAATIVSNTASVASTHFTFRTVAAQPPAGDSDGTTGGGDFTMNATSSSSSDQWCFAALELTVPGAAAASQDFTDITFFN